MLIIVSDEDGDSFYVNARHIVSIAEYSHYKTEPTHFEKVRAIIQLSSGAYIHSRESLVALVDRANNVLRH